MLDLQITVAAVSILIAMCAFAYNIWTYSKTWRDSKEEVEQAAARVEQQPQKAKPAWDLARVTLEAYFNRNLNQIGLIFWLSVVVMVVGFCVLTWGVSQVVASPTSIVGGVIAASGGVITEFIGATFLFIYRSTIQQAVSYSRTLERINSVGMAMQILDTIPNNVASNDLKSRTKASLVQLLVKQYYGLDQSRPELVPSQSKLEGKNSLRAPRSSDDVQA